MLADVNKGLISEEEKDALAELGFLAESEDNERKELFGYIDDLNGMNDRFEAMVIMNLDCNLACRYCFEGQRKGKFYMTRETADELIEFVRKRALGRKEISFIFYGGEPLLSVELIQYISEKLRFLAENNGLRYSFSFVTNGTLLTLQTVERLKHLGMRNASVTLDGPRNVHDICRPFKTGRGSFETILRNIKNVCDTVNIQISGNYTPENYETFPQLLDVLMERGLTPAKISSVKFDPVTKETAEFAPQDFHDGNESINEPWLFDAGPFLREEILKRGFRTAKITPAICMIDMHDTLVINYDGSIYKCPGLIGRKEFCVGSITTGVKDCHASHNLDNWKKEECLECAYLPLCFGGCRYSKFIRDGNMEGVDCKKPYLDATLEALVKQDIKYGLAEK